MAILNIVSSSGPHFLSISNIGNVLLGQSAISGMLAVGQLAVTIAGGSKIGAGGIDPSLAAIMGLSAAVCVNLISLGHSDGYAIAAALHTGLHIGAAYAVAVVLAWDRAAAGNACSHEYRGRAGTGSDAEHGGPDLHKFLTLLSGPDRWRIVILADVLVGFDLVASAIVHQIPLDSRLHAVGESPHAARAAGLPLKRSLAGAFLANRLYGGLAGILFISYLCSCSTGSGEALLPVVVIALLGTICLRGSVPPVPGTLLSALFISCPNDFQLLNLPSTPCERHPGTCSSCPLPQRRLPCAMGKV
jgi:ribose transport system permease protein